MEDHWHLGQQRAATSGPYRSLTRYRWYIIIYIIYIMYVSIYIYTLYIIVCIYLYIWYMCTYIVIRDIYMALRHWNYTIPGHTSRVSLANRSLLRCKVIEIGRSSTTERPLFPAGVHGNGLMTWAETSEQSLSSESTGRRWSRSCFEIFRCPIFRQTHTYLNLPIKRGNNDPAQPAPDQPMVSTSGTTKSLREPNHWFQ